MAKTKREPGMHPSPLHRDPEIDGDDYGLYTKKANRAAARLVEDVNQRIEGGSLTTAAEIVEAVQAGLRKIPSGCDTVVKENVFQALSASIDEADIDFNPDLIYGW